MTITMWAVGLIIVGILSILLGLGVAIPAEIAKWGMIIGWALVVVGLIARK